MTTIISSNITTVAQLDAAVTTANGEAANSGAYEIELGANASIALTQALTEINLHAGVTLDIEGNGATLDGENAQHGLFVYSGTVTIESLTIENAKAVGAAGNDGGGGGAGLGGGLFVGATAILPVCIKAGALGDNVPKRDLWISPHPAMYFGNDGGVQVEAKDIVNGTSIVQAQSVERVEYFHIELDTHDVIVAEGALSETFLDDNSRGMFHNAHDYETLYADEATASTQYCAPRCDGGYELETVRLAIAFRARIGGNDAVGVLRGYVDVITSTLGKGGRRIRTTPKRRSVSTFMPAAELIGQVLANRYREDLALAGLCSGRHSFVFRPPAGVAPAPETIEVRRSLDGALVEGCKPVGNRTRPEPRGISV